MLLFYAFYTLNIADGLLDLAFPVGEVGIIERQVDRLAILVGIAEADGLSGLDVVERGGRQEDGDLVLLLEGARVLLLDRGDQRPLLVVGHERDFGVGLGAVIARIPDGEVGARRGTVRAAQARELDARVGGEAVGRARVVGAEVEQRAEESCDDDEKDGNCFFIIDTSPIKFL